ncbi:hypothetical protein [Sphingopyxis macrogoltabida]|uniref:Uncharacterized protein n=1 Tax=Sphingopyxis macrogoltabida TaxID=33050 RepID=A0A0N9V0Y8_SPHMC|nr:hypothetical protein [Sphingopyxis macrogoltabida]ALH82943.1 hypothetical protein AN936_22070 [Sphingopyxis macrogoltabida]
MKALMEDRSARAEVRNPVLALPAMHRLAELSEEESGAVIAVMLDLKADAAERAQECWRRHKGPMAAYWKAVSVYAGHTAKALRRLSALRAQSTGENDRG